MKFAFFLCGNSIEREKVGRGETKEKRKYNNVLIFNNFHKRGFRKKKKKKTKAKSAYVT